MLLSSDPSNPVIPLLTTAYLPPLWYWQSAREAGAGMLEACEHYQKGSWRNRCRIAGPNGPEELSIPLLSGKHQRLPIREVRIAYDEPWQRTHWRALATAYGSAPLYEYYAPTLRPFFEKKWTFLFDYNLALMECLIALTRAGIRIALTRDYAPFPDGRYLDLRDRSKVSAAPHWEPKPYPQVFEDRYGFVARLSVIDALFCGAL
ncbi:MAG: WbqC family protein [Saprospiraceae bacterium]